MTLMILFYTSCIYAPQPLPGLVALVKPPGSVPVRVPSVAAPSVCLLVGSGIRGAAPAAATLEQLTGIAETMMHL